MLFSINRCLPSVANRARLGLPRRVQCDADFIRRISKDLRGTDPTPAEVHFFVASKDAGRRQKLIDLFIQERQAKKTADRKVVSLALPSHDKTVKLWDMEAYKESVTIIGYLNAVSLDRPPTGLGALQKAFYKELHAAKEKGDVSKITQAYLDRLIDFVKTNPKNQDVPDAMRQIVLVYESQGKTVEAGAWREKLRKEHPKKVSIDNFSFFSGLLK